MNLTEKGGVRKLQEEQIQKIGDPSNRLNRNIYHPTKACKVCDGSFWFFADSLSPSHFELWRNSWIHLWTSTLVFQILWKCSNTPFKRDEQEKDKYETFTIQRTGFASVQPHKNLHICSDLKINTILLLIAENNEKTEYYIPKIFLVILVSFCCGTLIQLLKEVAHLTWCHRSYCC